MSSPPTLATAIDEILDAIINALTTEKETGSTLGEVLVIERGDRAEPRPTFPAIYITPEKMKTTSDTTSLTEWWVMPVTVSSVVFNDCPVEGYQAATDLVARARAALLITLPLTYTKKIVSGTFDPAGPWSRNGDYYRATAEVKVMFQARG